MNLDFKEVSKIAKKVKAATAKIKECKEGEEKAKKEKDFLTTQVLPNMLEGMGKKMDLEDYSFTKSKTYKGFLPSLGSDIRDKAIDYFISKGYGADLDGKLSLEFDGDERDDVLRILKFLVDLSNDTQYLEKHGVDDLSVLLRSFYIAESVHYARLNSRLGDLYESQEDFEPKLFGFQVTDLINVK